LDGGLTRHSAAPTGRLLDEGDRVAQGAGGILTDQDSRKGHYVVNINIRFNDKDLLEEIRSAIVLAALNEGLEEHLYVDSVYSDAGALVPSNSSAARVKFNIYYKNASLLRSYSDRLPVLEVIDSGPGVLFPMQSFGPEITNIENDNQTLPQRTIKIISSDNSMFSVNQTRAFSENLAPEALSLKKVFKLIDFAGKDGLSNGIEIKFRDGQSPFFFLSPNHDVQIMSYGFGYPRSGLAHFEDLTVHGDQFRALGLEPRPNLNRSSFIPLPLEEQHTLDLDPVFFVKSSQDIRFPIRLKNIGSQLGFEMDGVIEPLDLREVMLGRTISEGNMRDIKGGLVGSYSYCKARKSSHEITSEIKFNNTSNVPFFDNVQTVASFMEKREDEIIGLSQPRQIELFEGHFYSIYEGIIFKNEEKVIPFLDAEEKQFSASILNGNNPEDAEADKIITEIKNLATYDNTNLGTIFENLRQTSGFEFASKDQPGSDSFVFGGLKYV